MAIRGFGNNNNWNNYNKNNKVNINKNVNANNKPTVNSKLNINNLNSIKSDGFVKNNNKANNGAVQLSKTWGDYQADYCNARLGEGWQSNGGAITANGFAEQTCALSTIYATVRWIADKVGGWFRR